MFGIERAKIDLLWELVKAHFKIKYNGSVLGFLWVFLKPFFLFIILYTVWTQFIPEGDSDPNYGVKLLIGLIVYTLFNDAIVLGMKALLDGAEIILRINYPRQINIMVAIIMSLINYVIGVVIFFMFSVILGDIHFTIWSLLYFLFLSAILVIAVTAISLFLSIALVWLRDLENINELFMRLIFFATPILYPMPQITGDAELVTRLIVGNPLGIMIENIRAAMIDGVIAQPGLMIIYFLVSLAALWLSWIFFQKQVVKIAEHF